MKSRIKYNILRIVNENLNSTIQFYTKLCGMTYTKKLNSPYTLPYAWQDQELHIFTYEHSENLTGLCFLVANNFKVRYANQGYWKIGLSLRDVDAAVNVFVKNDVICEGGEQFYDVGYLTALCDPNGYSVELLQHDFQNNFIKPTGVQGILDQPVNTPPVIGQITIRCTDAEKTCAFYTDTLGMTLLCIEQPDKRLPFLLYFFAYTDKKPPNSDDLHAIENREWLYKQTFCQIEIQHRLSLPQHFRYTTNDDNYDYNHDNRDGVGGLGHVGFALEVSTEKFEKIKTKCGIESRDDNDYLFISDPDGYRIEVTKI